jgi:DNA-binding winged helix-turn-helix (wHTH) protein
MHDRGALPQVIRFGPFALDVRVRELRKGPTRLKVPDQSIEILTALLERPGNLVTREELRHRLWPADTFVDFERGLNAAVWRLREALGDAADAPRFVETLPRRGYRFIGPIDDGRPATAGDQSSDTTARAAPASAEDARRVTKLYASLWRQAIVDQERAWKAYHHERELHREVDSRTFWGWLGRIRRTLKL